MLGAVVYVQVVDELAADAVFGEHAFHHLDEQGVVAGFDVLVERFFHQALGSSLALSARIAGVAQVGVVGPLFAGEFHFVGVDDDYVVATLNEG